MAAISLAAACAAIAPMEAGAQEKDEQTLSNARRLIELGDLSWDAGQYEPALGFYTQAYALVDAPTIANRRAECLERLGRTAEASHAYLQASRYPLDQSSSEPFKVAVATAKTRVVEYRGKLSTVNLRISGADVQGAQVSVDGRKIADDLVGKEFFVEPGRRVIDVVKGSRKASRTIVFDGGKSETLEVQLPSADTATGKEPTSPPAPSPVSPAEKPVPTQQQAQKTPKTEAEKEPATEGSSAQSTWGWVAIGVGGAGLATGVVGMVLTKSKRNSLDDSGECHGTRCMDTKNGVVDSYNTFRTVSTVGLVVGAVGVGAGLTLLLTAPSSNGAKSKEVAGVRPWIGLGSAGVSGAF